MAAILPGLNDALSMGEWLRRRNAQLSGSWAAGADAPDDDLPLADDLSMDDWQRARARRARGLEVARRDLPSRGDAARVETVALAAPGGSAGKAEIDPSKTDVFQRGADGKLHPIAGWHTTGPTDWGDWGRNIDWGGVGHDLGRIGFGVTGWLLPPAMGLGAGAAIVGNLGNAAIDTLDDLNSRMRPKGR